MGVLGLAGGQVGAERGSMRPAKKKSEKPPPVKPIDNSRDRDVDGSAVSAGYGLRMPEYSVVGQSFGVPWLNRVLCAYRMLGAG